MKPEIFFHFFIFFKEEKKRLEANFFKEGKAFFKKESKIKKTLEAFSKKESKVKKTLEADFKKMDLQWFAAEDEGRTEEPSEHKIRKAREEEGRVAKSQELIGALGLLLPGLTIFALAPRMLRVCVEMVQFYLYRAVELDPVRDGTIAVAALQYYVRLALPVALVAVIAALFSNFVQVGLLFTLKPLTPNFSKIVPRFGRYFQRIFSAEGLFNFFKSLVKMVIIGAVAFFLIRSKFDVLANLQTASLWTGLTTVANIAIRMIIISALLLLLLSIPDYMFQRWQYRESLKMSVEEVKRERKELDGDPLIKSRLRRRMQEIMTRDMLRRVPEADVVITNPTHLAIALEYHRENMAAPQVTAKGEDQTAAMIRRIAEQNGVPVMENKPLARALYQETRVGDIVPVAYWEVVARILSRVMDVNEKRRKERQDKE